MSVARWNWHLKVIYSYLKQVLHLRRFDKRHVPRLPDSRDSGYTFESLAGGSARAGRPHAEDEGARGHQGVAGQKGHLLHRMVRNPSNYSMLIAKNTKNRDFKILSFVQALLKIHVTCATRLQQWAIKCTGSGNLHTGSQRLPA